MKNKGMPTFPTAGLPTYNRPELWRGAPEERGVTGWNVNSEWGSELSYGPNPDILITELTLLVTKVIGKQLS